MVVLGLDAARAQRCPAADGVPPGRDHGGRWPVELVEIAAAISEGNVGE